MLKIKQDYPLLPVLFVLGSHTLCHSQTISEVMSCYLLTPAPPFTQDSCQSWSRRGRWRSVSGLDTTQPTSLSDGWGVPSQRSQTFIDVSKHSAFPCIFLR